MADVNAEIGVNINTSNALAQLKALQREIARFHASVAKSSEAAALAQRDLQKNFLNGVNAIQGFSAELRTVKTTAENFTDSLERNKFSMREYFRYSMASTKTFGRLFKSELDTVNKVAEEGVKRLQTQYIKMGRDASGAMKAIAVMPTKLNLNDFATQTQIAAQKQAIFNQLVKQGSTNLLNFGKNTQWAGRQLMVGFTIPLIGLGTAASRTFMDMETAAIKFKKVYGDLFTATEERDQALKDIEELGNRFTKYGIALADTVGLAAEAAAAGFKGIDLQRQVTEATRLQVLGQIEQQKALETTISLQNAFRLSSADLADSINFLNAVENQTVVSLDDITTAIPKAAPIVRELGGDVKDLAFFMAAMKEGGINASEGANALKSGLASLINPSDKARAMLSDFGIDIDAIVNKNAGNVKQTVVDFAVALDDLSSLSRQRAIEQLFGKFQQARLSALFDNVIRDGNQASRVLDLAGTSTEELAALAEQELGITANSSMNKFRKSVEDLKAALVPVGQLFLEIVTPFLENIGNLLDKFNDLSAGTKRVIGILTIGLGAIAPVVLMTVGLFANFVANGIKGLMLLRNGYLRLTGQSQILSEQTNFLTVEQQQALAAAASLEQSHMRLQQVFTGEAASVRALIAEYQRMIAAQNMAATRFPGMMIPGFKPQGYIDGVVSVPGPKGAGDVVPAMLSPGEAVISEPMNKKYAPLVQGIIADRIPGFETGVSSVAERFLATRAGRSASGGERAQVNIPGGYQLGHFAEVIQVTGEELRRLAETQSKGFKDTVERMIASVNGDLQHMFDIFTNEVTVQSKEFNQALGEIGSGKKAPVSMFREEAVFQSGAYNAPLIREMKKAGASTEEVDSAVRQLAQEFDTGISELGQVTEVTAEEVNSITQAAYERVSAVNEKVRVARERLQDPGAIKEILGVTSGRTPFAGGYNTRGSREDINEVVQEQMPGLYPTQQAFNFTGEAARKVGVQNAIAIREIYTQLGAEAQARVRALIGDIDAMSQQVVLEAQNSGIDIGRYAIQGITTGIDAASPSQKARQQGQNVADGFEQGILEGMDDVSMAGQKLGDAATQGIGLSDLTTDIRYTQGTLPGLNVSGSAENLTESLDDLDSATTQTADTTTSSGANLAKWNSRLMSTSFALSSISGIAMAFGNNLGGFGEKIFKVSSLMFALQGVIQLVTQAKLLELAAIRANTIATAMGSATGVRGLFAAGGFLKNIKTAGLLVGRFLGPIGATIGLISAGIAIYKWNNDRLEANRKKIDGLGDAALIAGDKLKTLDEIFSVDSRKFAFENFEFTGIEQSKLLTSGREQAAQDLIQNEKFQEKFKDDIAALKGATTKEAQLVLEGLAIQLQSRGYSVEQVQTITDALIKEAGQTEVYLDFKKLDISTKENQEELTKNVNQVLAKYNKAFAKGINDSYKRTLNLTAKSIAGTLGVLQLQLTDGTISAKEYATQVASINQQILAMPDSTAKLNLVNAVFASMGEDAEKAAAGVQNINNKLLLMQAMMLNAADQQSIALLSSSDLILQDIGRRRLTEGIAKAYRDLAKGLKEVNKESGGGKSGADGKGLTLQEKLIKIYEKQKTALEKKLKALRDVNDEIDRQNEFTETQLDLDKQIVEAKMSGNYLEAALLKEEKQANEAQFNRETQELELEEKISKIEERINKLEESLNAKTKIVLTAAEKRLLGIEEIADKKSKSENGKDKDNKDKDSKDKDSKDKDDADEAAQIGTDSALKNPVVAAKSPDQARDQARKDYENRPGNRKIPLPPPVQTGTKDYYFNTKTGKWELITRSSKTPAGYVSRQDYAKGKNTYAQGGLIKGPGNGTSDSIFAMVDQYKSGGMIRVSNGEYIFSKKAIDNAGGPKAIDAMHQRLRKAPAFRDGGLVGKSQPGDMANLDGQMVRINRGTQKQILADIKAAYAAEPNVKAFKDRIDYYQAIKEWDNKYSFVIPSQKSYPIAGGEHPLGSLSRFISVAKSQAAGGSYDAFYDATIASHAFKFFSPQVDRQVKDLLDSAPSEVFNRIGEIENLNKFSIASNKAYKLGNDLIAWCGAFVAWVAEQSGVNISKKMFSAFSATQEYKDLGTFKDPGSSLNVGDVVWWDWAKKFAAGSSKYKDATPGVPDHVDIITDKIGKSTFTAIGGGFGGSVGKRNINFNKEAQALYGSVTPEFQSFKDGGEVKKQNWFQRYVSGLTKTQDEVQSKFGMSPDLFGLGQMLRKSAGQSRKGDNPALAAALLPLNFLGFGPGRGIAAGVSKAGSVASGVSRTVSPVKASSRIMRNIRAAALENAVSQGRSVPLMRMGESEKIGASMLDKTSDMGAAFRKYWTRAFNILKEESNPLVKNMSEDDFIKYIAGWTEDVSTRFKGSLIDETTGPDITKAFKAEPLMQAANRAYLQAHGLDPSQPVSMFKAIRASNFSSDATPEAKANALLNQMGGYWSADSRMASSYLRNLNSANRPYVESRDFGGLYRVDLPAEAFPTPIGTGGWIDEYANVIDPHTIAQYSPKRVGTGWAGEGRPDVGLGGPGPQRYSVLNDFYQGVPFTGAVTDEAIREALGAIKVPGYGANWWNDLVGGRNPGVTKLPNGQRVITSKFLNRYIYGNETLNTGTEAWLNAISQMETILGQKLLVPKMAMGGYVNMASLPKFKNGIDNVPYDMPAILHKNERVLTAEENRRYGETNSTINATFNIAGGNSDEIVNKVMVKLNTLTNKNNKSNKVII